VRLGDVAGGPWSRGIWVGLGADVVGMMFMDGMVWYSGVRRTVCGHYVCEDWLDLFVRHDAAGEEGLEKGAVHVRVALVWRHIANYRRFISRHDGLVALLVEKEG
jgi:hypothetical protein